jgi:tetratricopeptide (TPR) repeat protein
MIYFLHNINKTVGEDFPHRRVGFLLGCLFCGHMAMATGDFQKGIELFERKNFMEARDFFTEILRSRPDHHVPLYYLGRIDFETGNFSGSIRFFTKAISMTSSNYEYYFWRGRANLELLFQANLMMKAVYAGRTLRDFEKAVELNPHDLESRIYLGEYYAQAPSIAGGSIPKAIAQFKAALSNHPGEGHLYRALGNNYRHLGNYDSAFYFHKKGVEIIHNYPMLHYELGKTGAVAGRELLLAEKSLIMAMQGRLDHWHHSDALYQLGRVREQLNKTELAGEAYNECLKMNPEHPECRKALRKMR